MAVYTFLSSLTRGGIAIMLLLPFLTYAQDYTPYYSPSTYDSMDQVVADAFAPYQIEGQSECPTLTTSDFSKISFDDGEYLFAAKDVVAVSARMRVGAGAYSSLRSSDFIKGYKLPAKVDVSLQAQNDCGEYFEVLSTDDEVVSVKSGVFRAIADWQKIPKAKAVNLKDYLYQRSDITYLQALHILQQTVYRKAPYSSQIRKSIADSGTESFKNIASSLVSLALPVNDPNDPFDPGAPPFDPPGPPFDPGDPPPSTNCSCTTIQLNLDQVVSPHTGVRSDGNGIRQLGMVYGSDDTEEFDGGDLKVWNAFGIRGPGKYKQLWAATRGDKCVSAPYTFGWNYAGSNDLDRTFAPQETASLSYNMLCFNGDNLPDGSCGCEREIRYDVKYNSVVRAQAEYTSGGGLFSFCANNRYARSVAEDYAIVAHGSEDDLTDFTIIDALANGQVVDCEQTYIGPTAVDFALLAFYIYAYTKGVDINTSVPAVDQTLDVAYQQYAASNAQSYLTNILVGPWNERTESCGGGFVGKNDNLSSRGRITLRPNSPHHIVLSTYSVLQVAGLRKWNANARIHSSYSIAGLIRKQTNANSGFEEHCCSPASAMYSMATISEDVVGTSGVTLPSWLDNVEAFFGRWDINQNLVHAVGYFEGSQPAGCQTDVDFSGTKSYDVGNEVVKQRTIELRINGRVITNLELGCENCVLRIVNINGQVIDQRVSNGNHVDLTLTIPDGVYFAVNERKDGSLSAQKFLYNR